MDRLFLDANILFSVVYREDNLSGLRRLWDCGAELITSDYAFIEAIRNLRNKSKDLDWSLDFLNGLMRNVTLCNDLPKNGIVVFQNSLYTQDIQLPDKDWPILLSAITCEATHLLTGDRQHFGPLFGRDIMGVRICRPSDYLSAHDTQQ